MATEQGVSISEFFASLEKGEPPSVSSPLLAIWYGIRGEWDGAHALAQAGEDRDSAWVHAWLHRIEGDLSNARYWYARAGETMPSGGTREEGRAIAEVLLERGR